MKPEDFVIVEGSDVLLLGTDEDHKPDPDKFVVLYRYKTKVAAEQAAACVRTTLADVLEAARREGAEAMREAAAHAIAVMGNGHYGLTGEQAAKAIRALPLPGREEP
jgi:hypothetical protein